MESKFESIPEDIKNGKWFSQLVWELKSLDQIQKNLPEYERLAKRNAK